MKHSDLKLMTADVLASTLLSLKKEQLNLRFQKATGGLKATHRVRQIRRSVARIKMLLSAQKNSASAA